MIIPNGMWILIVVSLLFCCVGFKRFVWFMSVGYGLSSAAIGLTLFIMALVKGQYSLIYLILCLVMVIYGIRLGGFLLVRELKNVSYQKKMQEIGGNTTVPVFVAACMWIVCGLLYVMESAGPIYRCLNDLAGEPDAALYIGTVIAAAGVLIEALSDRQKSKEKAIHSDLPAMHGLFRMCRCPNYFGEILFWTGIFVTGIGAVKGWQWLIAAIGYVGILIVMLSAAKRVEARHIKHYGKLPEYNAYADKTPLLFPLIPLYHLARPEKNK